MKISIITPTFNSERTVEDTIKSVLNQTYPDIEYIIIDGGSTDGTLDIIEKYKDKIAKIISEQDRGIYDAMNKGIKLATGDIVGILNSDDFYASSDIIEMVADEFREKNADCVWGDLDYVDKDDLNRIVRRWQSSPYEEGKFQRGWHPPHPTFFIKKEIYKKYGFFRLDLSISADYELMLRFLEKNKISSSYIPKVFVKMRVGGKSNKNVFNIIKANLQCLKAFRVNRLKVNPFLFFIKPMSKIFQFFKK